MTGVREQEMRRYWNARAREDPFYFVDSRQRYGSPDTGSFWEGDLLLDYVLGELGVQVSATDTVLEIGCGLGRMTRALAARAGQVIALDVSDEMLRRAREHNPHLGNVSWALGDGVSLRPLGDRTVDAVVSFVVFQHLPDPAITLGYVEEVGRVLRPGGWAALQVSTDPAAHRPAVTRRARIKALMGHGPRGQTHPAWVGSAIEVPALRDAAAQVGLELAGMSHEGTQYSVALLRTAPGRARE